MGSAACVLSYEDPIGWSLAAFDGTMWFASLVTRCMVNLRVVAYTCSAALAKDVAAGGRRVEAALPSSNDFALFFDFRCDRTDSDSRITRDHSENVQEFSSDIFPSRTVMRTAQ